MLRDFRNLTCGNRGKPCHLQEGAGAELSLPRSTQCTGGQVASDPWSPSKSKRGEVFEKGRNAQMERMGEGEEILVPVSPSGRREAGLQESARVTEGQDSWLLRSGSRRSYRNRENFY